jgi:hypothetical protein
MTMTVAVLLAASVRRSTVVVCMLTFPINVHARPTLFVEPRAQRPNYPVIAVTVGNAVPGLRGTSNSLLLLYLVLSSGLERR